MIARGAKSTELSGLLRLEGGSISYDSDRFGNWNLSLSDLRAVGEYTTGAGPFADDYFLVFLGPSDEWVEASFYADNRDEFLLNLSDVLGVGLRAALANSVEFRSRVMWPHELAGRPFFEVVTPARLNLRERVLKVFGLATLVRLRLAPELRTTR
jgi:hypothetical protein